MMTEEEIAEGKRQLSLICFAIGCSGLSKRCPGDPRCSILQKIGRSEWAFQLVHTAQLPMIEQNQEVGRNSQPDPS